MAVRAHKVTLRYLLENPSLAVGPRDEGAQLSELRFARAMVPLHRRVVEDATAVSARASGLEAPIPVGEQSAVPVLLRDSRSARSLVISGVVLPSARLAPGLVARSPSMELRYVLDDAAPTAAFTTHVVSMDIESDDKRAL
jgi:hypothetical protein